QASRFTSGGEYAVYFCRANIVESKNQVRGHVERAMKGYGERTGLIHQLPGARDVYISVKVEDAENDSIGTQLLGDLDVTPHGFEFVRLITKVAAARPDHDVEVCRYCGSRHFKKSGAGRDSAFDQTAA